MPHPAEHDGPAERFKATITAGVKEVETRLSLRRADLDKAWADLGNQWPGVQQGMADMGIVKKTPLNEHTVELNVRGSLVNSRRPLVEGQRAGGGLRALAALFDNVWDERLPRDADGRIVLDESPVCVKYLLHKVLEGSGAAGASRAMDDAFPADEKPYLPSVSRVLGLLPTASAPADTGMVVTGGSAVLRPEEVAPLTAEIQKWCPGNPKELRLLYRASRDGWKPKDFRAGCGAAAPTISLLRVMTHPTGRSYSVVGGFSTAGFAPPPPAGGGSQGTGSVLVPEAFVFMLKDGTVSSPGGFQPSKWSTRSAARTQQVIGPRQGINYGSGTLRLANVRGKIATSHIPFAIPNDSSFLRLNGRQATEIEVFEVGQEATVSPPPAKRSRRSHQILLLDKTVTDAPTPMTAQELSDDLHYFGALIAGPLKDEQTALFHARAALVQASDRAAASAASLKAIYGPEVAAGVRDDVVELSVRGVRMTTLRSTLRACSESALAARFDPERWAPTNDDLDEHGRQVVDCRPSCFSKVLDVLRMRKRAAWAGDDWKRGWGGATRLGIKAVDRGEFEEFVHMHFPGCERFVMDCVETRGESMV